MIGRTSGSSQTEVLVRIEQKLDAQSEEIEALRAQVEELRRREL